MPSSRRADVPDDALPPVVGDIDDVSHYLKCCRATVRREVARKRLRGIKVGQRWRFRREDVLAYLNGEHPA